MQIGLLGLFELKYRGEIVKNFHSIRLQEFISWLLLNRDTAIPRRYLSYQLWPNSNEQQARTNLRNLLYKTRKNLPDADSYLIINNATIKWNTDSQYSLDIEDFEDFIKEAGKSCAEGNISQQIRYLKKASEIYRGDLLVNCYKKWIEPERARYRKDYTAALRTLIQLLENKRCYEEGIPFAEKLIECDKYDELAYRKLIELYEITGNRTKALKTFMDFKSILWQDLKAKPSNEIKKLYARISK